MVGSSAGGIFSWTTPSRRIQLTYLLRIAAEQIWERALEVGPVVVDREQEPGHQAWPSRCRLVQPFHERAGIGGVEGVGRSGQLVILVPDEGLPIQAPNSLVELEA